MMSLAYIIPVLVLAGKVAIDYRQWLKKRNTVSTKSHVVHGLEWVIMVAACSPSIIILGGRVSVDWWSASWIAANASETLNLVTGYLIPAGMIAFFLWLFIDGLFNKLRGFGFWYTGSGEKTAANTDKLLKRLPLWLHILLKIGGFALFITLFLLYSQ